MVIIAPHPDDEIFGCAGLIALVLRQKQQVHVVILTGGGDSHRGCCDVDCERIASMRRSLALNAAGKMGLPKENVIFLDWPDGRIPHSGDVTVSANVAELKGIIERLRPDALFTPHPFEGWSDHIAAEEITRAALERSSIQCSKLFHYCVWFWFSMPFLKALKCNWKKAMTLPIDEVYDQKQAAMNEYIVPCAPCGKPWSGVLPREFLWAHKWRYELCFEVEVK
jgi:LmbE family N-acetylglucosaminyl deacetylase